MDWTSEAIGNLVKNALDHTEQGGIIRITWECTPSPYEIVRLNSPNCKLLLLSFLIKGGYQFMEILGVENLCKTYGKGEAEVNALKNVSFSLEKGEFAAVVGESGSGKSTLLNCIGALDTPASGSIFIDRQNLLSMKEEKRTIFRRRNIGFIFQSFQLVSKLDVEQNIMFPLLLDYCKPVLLLRFFWLLLCLGLRICIYRVLQDIKWRKAVTGIMSFILLTHKHLPLFQHAQKQRFPGGIIRFLPKQDIQ